ncbi:MAG: hypothetical protein COX65_08435 [Elusimicrobia bacterium CG_4_10_14_0_2_um_filter_56_8]|nr:MAG: hypothetical protein COX65_08435 [Elusimicrobia bacterium CG_4_10_14_0_2_um_filter_56_8]
MRALAARRLLLKHCRHTEEWRCGKATVNFTGKDENLAFDRRLYIYLGQAPTEADVKKITRLLRLLDRLGHGKKWPRLTHPGKRGTVKK